MSSARRIDDPAVVAAIAAVVLGALWLAVFLQQRSPGDDSAEAGFARDMIVHHAQAVEMAEIVRSRTHDPGIRILATDIALTQQAQIGQMRGWLDVWGLPQAALGRRMAWMGPGMDGPMPGMAPADEVIELGQVNTQVADVRFLRLMIPHHQAAIEMSKAALQLTERPEVRAFAQGVILAQRSEIAYMQDLLRQRGAPPATTEIEIPGDEASGHEDTGFAGSVASTARATARAVPPILAIFAFGWLLFDTARRRRTSRDDRRPDLAVPNAWTGLAVGGLLASGLLHAGLAPTHFDQGPAYGWFFVVAAVLASLSSAAVLGWPSRTAYRAGVALSVALIVIFVVFRLVPPPGAESPEDIDLVGLVTKATESAAAVACMMLLSVSRSHRGATSHAHGMVSS